MKIAIITVFGIAVVLTIIQFILIIYSIIKAFAPANSYVFQRGYNLHKSSQSIYNITIDKTLEPYVSISEKQSVPTEIPMSFLQSKFPSSSSGYNQKNCVKRSNKIAPAA